MKKRIVCGWNYFGRLAQLVRALHSHCRGHWFESNIVHHSGLWYSGSTPHSHCGDASSILAKSTEMIALVAQWIERRRPKAGVAGSIPAKRTK
jgi:hypothetical protein